MIVSSIKEPMVPSVGQSRIRLSWLYKHNAAVTLVFFRKGSNYHGCTTFDWPEVVI
jgi:hypothetical protein